MTALDPSALEAKRARWNALFAPLEVQLDTCIASPREGYRMRAEFRVWHDGEQLNYVMFPPGEPNKPQIVHRLPAAHLLIQALMPTLLEALGREPKLRRKLFQIEFLVTLSGDRLVSLIYHRPLDEAWDAAAYELSQQLGISIVGRSRGQKRIIGRDYVDETLQVHGRAFHYRQFEQSFTQPNALINQAMIGWTRDQLGHSPRDLLELYCGNGNFTLPLADLFRRVIATEVSKRSIEAAQHNRQRNQVENLQFARLSSAEMASALRGERPFRRLAGLTPTLQEHDFDTVLVDPPRAGLDADTLDLLQRFPRILYISCNPQTLFANAQTLASTHRIVASALFDQFPDTPHIESGLLLYRQER